MRHKPVCPYVLTLDCLTLLKAEVQQNSFFLNGKRGTVELNRLREKRFQAFQRINTMSVTRQKPRVIRR
jgi:hypothetical protein